LIASKPFGGCEQAREAAFGLPPNLLWATDSECQLANRQSGGYPRSVSRCDALAREKNTRTLPVIAVSGELAAALAERCMRNNHSLDNRGLTETEGKQD